MMEILSGSPVCFPFPDDPGRDPGDDGILGNVSGYDCPSGDNRLGSDSDTGEDHRPGKDLGVVPYPHRRVGAHGMIRFRVTVGKYPHEFTETDRITKSNPPFVSMNDPRFTKTSSPTIKNCPKLNRMSHSAVKFFPQLENNLRAIILRKGKAIGMEREITDRSNASQRK
jgi:hypothetical protein